MSSYASAAFVVRCDHCGHEQAHAGPRANAVETRWQLYEQGWRFPSLTIDGTTQRVDLCPGCLVRLTR